MKHLLQLELLEARYLVLLDQYYLIANGRSEGVAEHTPGGSFLSLF